MVISEPGDILNGSYKRKVVRVRHCRMLVIIQAQLLEYRRKLQIGYLSMRVEGWSAGPKEHAECNKRKYYAGRSPYRIVRQNFAFVTTRS